MIKIQIEGLDRVVNNLQKFQAGLPGFFNDTMQKTILYVQGKLPPYPPPPTGSTYRRTGTLGRSITSLFGQHPDALSKIQPFGGGVHGIIGTQLKYAPFVIDEDRQAGVHRGRWWTLQQAVRNQTQAIVDYWKKAVDLYIKRYL